MGTENYIGKIVFWDIDGVISDPMAAEIINPNFLKVTLNLLQDKGIHSVIGSQRLLYMLNEGSNSASNLTDQMFKQLNKSFGKNRTFLIEKDARLAIEVIKKKCGGDDEKLQQAENASNKVDLIGAYPTVFEKKHLQIKQWHVTHVDDSGNYEKSTKDAGHHFVHVTPDSRKQCDYLFEVLLENIGIIDALQTLDDLNLDVVGIDKGIKESYQQALVEASLRYYWGIDITNALQTLDDLNLDVVGVDEATKESYRKAVAKASLHYYKEVNQIFNYIKLWLQLKWQLIPTLSPENTKHSNRRERSERIYEAPKNLDKLLLDAEEEEGVDESSSPSNRPGCR